MRRSIEPTVGTFLDVFTGEFHDDEALERRMFEAVVACIERASGNPEPLRLLWAVSRQLRIVFGRNAGTLFDTRSAAQKIEVLILAMAERPPEVVTRRATVLGLVLAERAALAQHAAKFRMRRGEFEHAMFDGSERIEPPFSHHAGHMLEAYRQTAETIDIHLALLDSALFIELTGLRWEMREGQFLSRPFPEADLIAVGFPTVEERLRYTTGNPTLRV